MNVVYKPKSVVRQETNDAVAAFLKAGGSIEIVPRSEEHTSEPVTLESRMPSSA